MKLDIIRTLRQSKTDIKDVKTVGIHKMVHQVYKGSTGELRVAAKDLVSFWKIQIKAAASVEVPTPVKGYSNSGLIEVHKKETAKKNNGGKVDKGKKGAKNGKPEVPVKNEAEMKAKLRETTKGLISKAIDDPILSEEIERGNKINRYRNTRLLSREFRTRL